MDAEKSRFFIESESSESFDAMPGVRIDVLSGLTGEKMTMIIATIQSGVNVPAHSHPHEQVGMVVSGGASFRIGDDERIVRANEFYRIPSDVEHEVTAVGDEPFVTYETFYPVRQDFIDKLKKS